jgi:hypothetical protein
MALTLNLQRLLKVLRFNERIFSRKSTNCCGIRFDRVSRFADHHPFVSDVVNMVSYLPVPASVGRRAGWHGKIQPGFPDYD